MVADLNVKTAKNYASVSDLIDQFLKLETNRKSYTIIWNMFNNTS